VRDRLLHCGIFTTDELDAVHTIENVKLMIDQQFNHFYDKPVSPSFINDLVVDTITQLFMLRKFHSI
jgi:hypothetical protein